ncbi:MAG: SynChlorMet cassette protein ScmC [Syntrophobacterales bacterium]|jgi:SynChlorMet cassette protein ScmC
MIVDRSASATIAGTYLLPLSDGQAWRIIATEGIKAWVSRLARIMGLSTCESNEYPRIIFIWSKSFAVNGSELISRLGSDLKKGFPRKGWNPWNYTYLRLWCHPEVEDVLCEIWPVKGTEQDILRMRSSLQPVYQKAQDGGGLPLHAALVKRNGMGVMLAGPKNTGKSTCCRRIPPPWHALSDEETLIVLSDDNGYMAHPFPTWSDYLTKPSNRTWKVQSRIPLSSIFFLEQSDTDKVTPIGLGEAAVFVYQTAMQVCHRYFTHLDHEHVRTRKEILFENACELAKTVPAFKLQVSLRGRFWEKMESVLP